jgi:PHD/YefM family antitoxin component YafN of YafNO toxin-antitoxin module
MKLSQVIKPVSYLKTDADIILSELESKHQPVAIAYHGEVKVVLQDIASYEATQESLALLKMLAISSKSRQAGDYKPVTTAFSDIRKNITEAQR